MWRFETLPIHLWYNVVSLTSNNIKIVVIINCQIRWNCEEKFCWSDVMSTDSFHKFRSIQWTALSSTFNICVALRSKRDLNISKIYQKRSIFRLDKGIKLHLCLEAFVVEISRIQESGSGGIAGLSKNLAWYEKSGR